MMMGRRGIFLNFVLSCLITVPVTAQCFTEPVVEANPKPVLALKILGPSTQIAGEFKDKLDIAVGNAVGFCVLHADKTTGGTIPSVTVDEAGRFVASKVTLESGDTVTMRLVIGTGGKVQYGPSSDPVTVAATCQDSKTTLAASKPKLKLVAPSADNVTVSTTASDKLAKSARLCTDDGLAIATIKPSGTSYSFSKLNLDPGAKVYVELLGDKDVHLASSDAYAVPAVSAVESGYILVMIAGGEFGGYSSQSLTTDAFAQFYLNEQLKWPSMSAWQRVRLLGASSATTNGVGSYFNDPTGTISKLSFDTVGETLDYTLGLQWTPNSWISKDKKGRASIIAGFGATTPLTSQNPVIFAAPAAGSYECSDLLTRFTAAKGYRDLTSGAGLAPPACLVGADGKTAITDIAFVNEDRSNFLFKWGAGVRMSGKEHCDSDNCTDAAGLLDLSIGQDSAITGGYVRHFVMKADGIVPIKTGDASYLYFFGSAYLRMQRNQTIPSLTLAPSTDKATIPSPAVLALPFKQPDRDFFRLGVGINLGQVFCKLTSTGCSKS
jgi:hypothetical protein